MPAGRSSGLTSPALPILFVLAAAVLFGASAPLSKLMLAATDPVVLAALLYLGSGAGMAIVKLGSGAMGKSGAEAPLKRSDAPWLLSALLAGGIMAPMLMMVGLSTTPAAFGALLLNFEAVGTIIIARLMFREAVGRGVWLALVLITAGSMAVSVKDEGGWALSIGALGILAACFLWGLDNNLTRNISAKDPVSTVAIKGVGAGLFGVAFSLVLGRDLPALPGALAAVSVGFVCYGLSMALYIRALRDIGAARTGALFGAAPFIGVLLGLVIFNDPVTAWFVLSFLLTMAGAILLFWEAHGHRHAHALETHEHRHAHDDGHHVHEHGGGTVPHGPHSHVHTHEALDHEHRHAPDLHHRHPH